jgi:hypothetical protein
LGSDPFGLVGILEASGKALAVDPALESDETLMASAVALDVARSTLEAAEALSFPPSAGHVGYAAGLALG